MALTSSTVKFLCQTSAWQLVNSSMEHFCPRHVQSTGSFKEWHWVVCWITVYKRKQVSRPQSGGGGREATISGLLLGTTQRDQSFHLIFKWNPKGRWHYYYYSYSHLINWETDRRRGERLNTSVKVPDNKWWLFSLCSPKKQVWKKDMMNKYRYFRTLEEGFTGFYQPRLPCIEGLGSLKKHTQTKILLCPFPELFNERRCAGGSGFCWATEAVFSRLSWFRLLPWRAGIPQGKAVHCA